MSTEKVTVKLEADVEDAIRGMAKMQKEMAAADKQAADYSKSISYLGKFALVGEVVAGAISKIGDAMQYVVSTGFKDAMDDEMMAVQLSSFTKSIKVAKELQGQLDYLAANGVVGLEDLGRAAQALAMEFRDDVPAMMEWVEVFADIAASGKVSAEAFCITGGAW